MIITIEPFQIHGKLTAPASKSAMQRACAAALLRGGRTVLHNPGISNDDHAAMDIITRLGARVERDGDTVVIESKGVNPVDNLNCGESGLSVRMFTPIAALSDRELTITGEGSLLKRPVAFFDEVLPRLGVSCTSNYGFLPMKIKGPLKPAAITVDGSLSSQFLTGLLFAFSASHARNIALHVDNLNSKPYIDLTLKIMQEFGLNTPTHEDYTSFYFSAKESSEPAGVKEYSVEGDWSGAAFLLVAGAIAGEIEVQGLDVFSSQADRAVLQPLMQAEAVMSIQPERIRVSRGNLRAFHFNANDCPDLFPPLVALAAYCEGTSVIEGVQRLTHKESNRALTLQEEFGKMGLSIELQDDLMIIRGGRGLRGAGVHSHHDHRIAMACAVAGLRAEGPTSISAAEAVNKSYPAFWDHLELLQIPLKRQQVGL